MRSLIGFLCVLVAMSSSVSAQSVAPADKPIEVPFSYITTGTPVRIKKTDGRYVFGRFAAATAEGVQLGDSQASMIRSSEIASMWKRRLSSTEAVLLGAVAGGVAGVVFGVSVSHGSCAKDAVCSGDRLIPVTAILGAILGGALGELFGENLAGWKKLSP